MHLDNEPGVVVEYTLIIEFTFLAIKSSCFKRDKMFREREKREIINARDEGYDFCLMRVYRITKKRVQNYLYAYLINTICKHASKSTCELQYDMIVK